MGKHIPGNPTFVVQNMPAAGSLVAANHLANVAPRDGTMIGLMQRGVLLAPITNPNAVRYSVTSFRWIGSLASETGVTLAYESAPHRTAKDLFEKELIIGASAGVDPETTARLYNALLGTKFKIVMGYNGTTAIGLAMEKGEVQGIADWSWSSLKAQRPAWIRDKKVHYLLQGALERDKELPDVPNALDFVKDDVSRKVLELYFTQKTVARPLLTPPDVPADRVESRLPRGGEEVRPRPRTSVRRGRRQGHRDDRQRARGGEGEAVDRHETAVSARVVRGPSAPFCLRPIP